MKTTLFLFALCSTALAEDLTTVTGKTYNDVRVIAQTEHEVTFSHTGGTVVLEGSDLPDAWRKKLGFVVIEKPEVKPAATRPSGTTTVAGYLVAATEELLEKATSYIIDNDEAALKKLMASGLVAPLKAGLDVKIVTVKPFKGMVKFRQTGEIVELWTVSEAIK